MGDRVPFVTTHAKLSMEQLEKKNPRLLELSEGQTIRGVVAAIDDVGVYVDLIGIQGFLHISELSRARVNHPSELVAVGQEVDVEILRINRSSESVTLTLKHTTPSPWEQIGERYAAGSIHHVTVICVTAFGAYVRLEDGIETLVHISEMSWTKRISHPDEFVHVGDTVEVIVLECDAERHHLGLSMKLNNPWDTMAQRYPSGKVVQGTVRIVYSHGAFVEIEAGIDGLLRTKDISSANDFTDARDALSKGQKSPVK